MLSKSRIALAGLAALLVAALVGCVVINQKLTDTKVELSETAAELAEARQASEALSAELNEARGSLEAARAEAAGERETAARLQEALDEASARVAALEGTLAERDAAIAALSDADDDSLQARLDAAEDELTALQGQLHEKFEAIVALNEAIAALDWQDEDHAARLDELQQQLDAAEAEAQTSLTALSGAMQTYERSLSEVGAYRVERAPDAGEAPLSTSVENTIQVAADGVTAMWQYANSGLSGNSARIALVQDGETIYASDLLRPGEHIDRITLNTPLAPGAYTALAVTTVYDRKDEPHMTSRVPVTLVVGEE